MVCRQVVDEMDVPFIDMQWLTEQMVAKMGLRGFQNSYLWVPLESICRFAGMENKTIHLNPEGQDNLLCWSLKVFEHFNYLCECIAHRLILSIRRYYFRD